jgi:hypothetical protein
LLQSGENRLVGQALISRRLGNAEINDFGNGNAIVQGDENIRGLDIAVNDALLVRMLDGVANLTKRASRSVMDNFSCRNNR